MQALCSLREWPVSRLQKTQTMNPLGEITASEPMDREAIERENAERVRARGGENYGARTEPPKLVSECDILIAMLNRVEPSAYHYYQGRFTPFNKAVTLVTSPGAAVDFIFDKDGKLLKIDRRHCVIEND